jgi:hypothetical protein
MGVLVLLLAVVIGLLGVLVAGLLRSHAEILRALHDLGAGLDPDEPVSPAAAFEPPRHREPRAVTDLAGVTPRGDAISFSLVGGEHLTLVAFLTSGCSTCSGFWSAFDQPDRLRVPGNARLVVATKGPEEESPARVSKFASPDLPVVMSSAAWDAFDVPVAPYFALVDGPTGAVIGEGAANTWEHLRTMLDQALADAGMANGRRRRSRARATRETEIDAQLRRAGLEPGDPTLYSQTDADVGAETDPGRLAP